MYKYSKKSLARKKSCHPALQQLLEEVIKYYDITIVWGHRSFEQQEIFYSQGKSKLKGGESKHNFFPSLAIDIHPYPLRKKNGTMWHKDQFIYMGGQVKMMANVLGIDIRWGGDWDNDNDLYDQTFNDLMHFELI